MEMVRKEMKKWESEECSEGKERERERKGKTWVCEGGKGKEEELRVLKR